MKKILSFCTAMLVALAVNAATINIDNTTADALRKALNGAATGDEIVMAAGTYVESNGDYIAFTGKDVTVRAAEGAEVILQPQVPIRLKEGAVATFVGIKFDCGHLCDIANYENLIVPADDTDGKSVVLESCEFYNWPQVAAIIRSTTSRRLSVVNINNCYFHDIMKSCLFLENTNDAYVQITNSTFANISTSSSYSAGVIDSRATAGSFVVDHCTFYNVHAMNTDYAAIGKVKLASGAIVSNCIFAMSEAAPSTDRTIRDVVAANNCLVFNYTADSGWGMQSNVTRNGDCIKDQDPKFVDAANGDFTLGDGSPALGAAMDGTNLGDPRWSPASAALTEPDAAATAPTWPENQVKAVYSDTYSADCSFGEWGSGTVYTDDTYGKKFVTTGLGYFGLEFTGLNCAQMEKLHLDVWIADDASILIVPIHGGTEVGVTAVLQGQQWNSVDIALSEFVGVADWTNVYQIKIANASNLTFWLDNIYFYTTVAPAVDEDAPTNFTAVLKSASYFGATLTLSAEDASGSVIYDVMTPSSLVLVSANGVSGVARDVIVPGLVPGQTNSLSVIAKDESGNETAPINVDVLTLTAPLPAPVPDFSNKENIVSLFCDERDDNVPFHQGWWGQSTVADVQDLGSGDLVWYLSNMNYLGWELDNPIDVSAAEYLHIDFYATDMTEVSVTPISPGHEGKCTVSLEADGWASVDIPLSSYTGDIDWAGIFQMKFFDATPAGTDLFIDNVYFYSEVVVPTIDIVVNEGVVLFDGTAEGYWQMMGENDVYAVSITASSDHLAGSYTEADLFIPDYAWIGIKATSDYIDITTANINVVVNGDGSVDLTGSILGTDNNLYNVSLHYTVPSVQEERDFTDGAANLGKYGGYDEITAESQDGAEIDLFFWNPFGVGTFTIDDLLIGWTEFYDENGDFQNIYEANIVVEAVSGSYHVTGSLLMYNNVQYNLDLTIPGAPTSVENNAVENETIKRIENGQLIIRRNGKTFNAIGAEIK